MSLARREEITDYIDGRLYLHLTHYASQRLAAFRLQRPKGIETRSPSTDNMMPFSEAVMRDRARAKKSEHRMIYVLRRLGTGHWRVCVARAKQLSHFALPRIFSSLCRKERLENCAYASAFGHENDEWNDYRLYFADSICREWFLDSDMCRAWTE